MRRVEVLREQAAMLRTLADSFDAPEIKADLLALADRCDQLAARVARQISDRLQEPIAAKRSPVHPKD